MPVARDEQGAWAWVAERGDRPVIPPRQALAPSSNWRLDVLPLPSLQGVVAQFRVMDGELRRGDVVRFMNTRCEHPVAELGVLAPKAVEVGPLGVWHVGWGG